MTATDRAHSGPLRGSRGSSLAPAIVLPTIWGGRSADYTDMSKWADVVKRSGAKVE